MRRRTSLLLSISVATLCSLLACWSALSYLTSFGVSRSWADSTGYIEAERGLVTVWRVRSLGLDVAAYPPFDRSARFAGFGVIHIRSKTLSIGQTQMIGGFSEGPVRYRYIPGPPPKAVLSRGYTVPAWFLCACFSVYPFVQARRLRRHLRKARRRERGLCAICGYDLRATHDRCPECGVPTSTAPGPAHNLPMQWTDPDV